MAAWAYRALTRLTPEQLVALAEHPAGARVDRFARRLARGAVATNPWPCARGIRFEQGKDVIAARLARFLAG